MKKTTNHDVLLNNLTKSINECLNGFYDVKLEPKFKEVNKRLDEMDKRIDKIEDKIEKELVTEKHLTDGLNSVRRDLKQGLEDADKNLKEMADKSKDKNLKAAATVVGAGLGAFAQSFNGNT